MPDEVVYIPQYSLDYATINDIVDDEKPKPKKPTKKKSARKKKAVEILTFLQRLDKVRNEFARNSKIELMDGFFNDKAREMTIGLEVELVLVHKNTGRPVKKSSLMDDLLENYDGDEVYRDYYPHQLEIRTGVHDNPTDCFKEYEKLFNSVLKKAEEHGLSLAPTTYFRDVEFCGTHIHIKYKDEKGVNYYRIALASYPFVLSLALGFRDLPSENFASKRIALSPHINTMTDIEGLFMSGSVKMADIFYNKSRREGKHRVKDVDTLETRIYDTIEPKEMKDLLTAHYDVFSRIKEVCDEDIKSDKIHGYMSDLFNFRRTIGYNMLPYNKLFNMYMDEYFNTASQVPYLDFSKSNLGYMLKHIRGFAELKNVEKHMGARRDEYRHTNKSAMASDFFHIYQRIGDE